MCQFVLTAKRPNSGDLFYLTSSLFLNSFFYLSYSFRHYPEYHQLYTVGGGGGYRDQFFTLTSLLRGHKENRGGAKVREWEFLFWEKKEEK